MNIQQKFFDFWSILYNFVLPKDKDVLLIENMGEKDIFESIPMACDFEEKHFKALFQYKNKLCKKAIWAIKYNGNKNILIKFCKIFYDFIIEDMSEKNIFSPFEKPLIIPIPMYKDDIKKRGFNQSVLIAEELFKIDQGINFEIEKNILKKIKKTPHQSSLKNKKDRIKNLDNCFSINNSFIKNRNILLIDDVITTGKTMNEARRTLKNAGAKTVLCFSLAH